jgi:hypothetical protein
MVIGFNINTTKYGIKCIRLVYRNDCVTFPTLNDEQSMRMSEVLRHRLYNQAYGAKQYYYIACLVDHGFVRNIGTKRDKKSLDTMIDRVQAMLLVFNQMWNTNFEILYGKLDDTTFGYYLRSANIEDI